MKDNLFLGVDFGTQGVRVGITDMEGKIIESAEVKYAIKHGSKGFVTQEVEDSWEGFRKALKESLESWEVNNDNIKAISICSTSATVVAVDDKGNALDDAIMWMDIRARDQARRINETNHPVLKQCGDAVSPEWFLPKVLWLKEEKKEVYDKAHKIVEQLDLINFRLTGNWTASKVNAVCKWNYIDGKGFDDEYMDLIGLDDYKDKIVTNVLSMGEKVGNLSPLIAKEFGLKEIPIYQGGIDAHIGMIGMGVVKPGKMAAIMGTSFVQLLFTDSDLPVKGIWGPYKEAMVEGYTLLEGGQVASGSIIKWFEKIFEREGYEDFKEIQEKAANVPMGANGVMATDFFQGNRTPYKDSDLTGTFHGLTLNTEKEDIYRAIMESVAFGFKNIIVNFENSNVEIDKVIGTGGVTQDKVWMQIIADVTGKEFIINENTNYGTIAGCAVIAATGSGSYENLEEAADNMVHERETVYPNLENTKEYEKYFAKYLELYEAVKDIK
ncbi:MAG: carbohydrate kinase [Clostridium sp.]|nr:carbohydrate kinase [Clostridium sp.]